MSHDQGTIFSTASPIAEIASDVEESLFGSPPPSPTLGRSPSLELALPVSGAGNGTSLISQNVGAIALPGSQHCSELPINPLALSLSYAPRPPAHIVQDQTAGRAAPSRQSSAVPSTPSTSRASSTAPRHRRKQPERDIPRPPPPEIPMPDPSQPVPANFFRNQTALLGTAGLVSGLKPATLKVNSRGSTIRNPIVIPEDPRPRQPRPKSTITDHLNARNLPTPTTREIVHALIKEKNLFPVLSSILKLVTSGAFNPSQAPSSSVPETQHEEFRPAKRRKLRRVPAGAADWDTPFPFKDGEGPKDYRANWERERSKQLVAELVGIIKTATYKAAAKSFVQREPDIFSHLSNKGAYLPSSQLAAHSPPPTPSGPSILTDSSINNAPNQTSPQEPDPLNDLLTSLLSAQSEVPSSFGEDQAASALFDNWMSIFQSFPQPSSSDDPLAFLSALDTSFQNTSGLELGEIENPMAVLDPALEPATNLFDHNVVDPSLLGLSIPTSMSGSSSAWSSYPSSSIASPMHSSVTDFELFTPTSSEWNAGNTFAPSGLEKQQSPMIPYSEPIAAFPSRSITPVSQAPARPAVPPPPLKKDELIKLAIQRRKELSDELVKARMQLWETTIEQGVLAHLVKTIR